MLAAGIRWVRDITSWPSERIGRVTLTALWLTLTAPAAALAHSARFEIPSQPLPAALRAFATQAHVQLFYVYRVVEHARGNSVQGELETRTALTQLLRGTGLVAIYTSETEATIREAPLTPDAASARH